jgi:hypothetical protein
MSKHAAEFVALVTDGQIIDGFGTRCEKCGQPTEKDDGRKAKFLRLGRAVMKDLAEELKFGPGNVYVNPAGPAVSGDIYIHAEGLYVLFSAYGGLKFLVRRFDTSVWIPWEELLDLRMLAQKIAALCSEEIASLGVSIERSGGTPPVIDVLEALENDLDPDEAPP